MTEIQEIALTESRTLREMYVNRTDVLDKVKSLRMLPGDIHVTTEMVAEYYEVPVNTVYSLVKDNRTELSSNGYATLHGAELTSFKKVSGINSRARELALFPRRAVLNVGQLLRDSEVARQVRTYLLDAEQMPTHSQALRGWAEEVERRELEQARRAAAEARAEVAEDSMREIEGGDGLSIRMFHKKYFSEVGERVFFEHLYAKGYLIDQRGKGGERPDGSTRDGSQHRHPAAKGKPYLYFHFAGVHGDRRRESTRVRPGQPELALKAALVHDGMAANQNGTGYLFAIEGEGA
jgi:hypothetical protein